MTGADPPTRDAGSRRFVAALLGISVVGLVLRVVYVLTVTRYDTRNFYDAFYYVGQAGELVAGHGFQTPVVGVSARCTRPSPRSSRSRPPGCSASTAGPCPSA